ncbi:hypothetical protein [Microbacterium sp.]|uniref:hypothetical protein n=1 Tax=Microbacterium sp. TaxID=51671 RepID=UPI003A8C8205
MQLGTRWTSGAEIPAAVPPALHEQIRAIDEVVAADPRPRWTLTFLEGRPIAELDNGVIVEQTPSGEVTVSDDAA